MTLDQHINYYLNRQEKILEQIIAESTIPAVSLREAMHYALFPGGKRFRPLLAYLIGEVIDVPAECIDYIAASLELTHCYSLVHDDLPAMDNDDFRRGRPSCHRAFDEATAILAGDALRDLAIEILLEKLPLYLSSTQVIAVTKALLVGSGVQGMISGQAIEMVEQGRLDEARLFYIHSLKTGELILAATTMTLAAATGVSETARQALIKYTSYLGLVFQMQDDYLDLYAQNTHGKGRSSDAENLKTTYATLYSKEELESLINEKYSLAREALACFGEKASFVNALTDSLQARMLV